MLTTNNYDYAGFTAADKNWLETNCIAVEISERVYEEAEAAHTPREEERPRGKRVWSSPTHRSPDYKRTSM